MNVFPQNDKAYCVISWLEDFDETFSKYVSTLRHLTELQKKRFIDYQLVVNTEDLVMSPRLVHSYSESEKENFGMTSMMEMMLFPLFDDNELDENHAFENHGYSLFN
ncbi:hypothetical protein JCM31185_06940 [Furfurilactobacillus curtus]|uniref:Uncharacterized protein n=1 Tax=Furfurilactobacillus curtus TaxID=1746200 RepID=A0ABQ5JMH7_9LACO